MSKTVNIHEAKTHLSRLLEEAVAGEEVIIAKAGRPMVRLAPVEPPERRRLGFMKGIWPDLPEEFWFEPLPDDELELWEQ
jgi:prevent-host-death family protein